jgi:hypothetical protein
MQSPDVLYPNLAFIRSHEGDAFFGSEYRALLYFPDDPKFLTDQYEVTVELMMWLGTALKFNERLSQMLSRELSDRMREDLETMVHPPASDLDEEHVKAHRRDLDRIGRLRGQAGDVQTLVSKAGVSRYKDHGDLMIRLVEGMKFDRLVELLDRRLAQLDGLYRQIVDRIEREAERVAQERAGVEERRNQRIGVAFAIVSSIIGIGALKDLIEGLFYSAQSSWKERVTWWMMWLALIIVILLIGYWWTHDRKTSNRRPA